MYKININNTKRVNNPENGCFRLECSKNKLNVTTSFDRRLHFINTCISHLSSIH